MLKINGLSIITHVFKKAEKADIGEVVVATEDQEIMDDVKKNGGKAILTNKKHKTGTDRIYEALNKLEISNIDLVMNLQGDEPLMNIDDIRNLNKQMIKNNSKLGTLGSKISDDELYLNKNVVKVITKQNLNNLNFPEAEFFSREVQDKNKNIFHHLGIYCYQKDTLKKFVSYAQSSNEIKNKLEQLRALDNKIEYQCCSCKILPNWSRYRGGFCGDKKNGI